MNKQFAYSVLTVKATEDDGKTRRFSGIATTPTPDRVGDIVEPRGAQFQLPVPLLWQHDSRAPTLWSLGPKAPTVDQIAALTAQQQSAKVVRAAPRPKAPARSIFEVRPEERRAAMEAPVPAPGSFMAEWRRKRGEGA